MRSFFTWLMIFGIIAGFNLRVLAADGSCVVCLFKVENCKNEIKNDKGFGARGAQQGNQGLGGDKCPVNHHHHRCCNHGMPIVVASETDCALDSSGSDLLEIRHEDESLPDDPLLGSEKPPLI